MEPLEKWTEKWGLTKSNLHLFGAYCVINIDR